MPLINMYCLPWHCSKQFAHFIFLIKMSQHKTTTLIPPLSNNYTRKYGIVKTFQTSVLYKAQFKFWLNCLLFQDLHSYFTHQVVIKMPTQSCLSEDQMRSHNAQCSQGSITPHLCMLADKATKAMKITEENNSNAAVSFQRLLTTRGRDMDTCTL